MNNPWQMNDRCIEAVRRVIDTWSSSPLVIERKRRNLASTKPPVGRDQLWIGIVASILTSQQRSGPTSPVMRFLCKDPFPLSVSACECQPDLAAYARDVLTESGGIRYAKKRIPGFLHKNLPWVTGSHWDECCQELAHLNANDGLQHERRVADFFDDRFWGLGPKQARNLLQMLGQTRHVLPIDSRIAKWLATLGFDVDTKRLGNRSYYETIEDSLQLLCQACNVSPCILDACVFASFDDQAWTTEKSRW